MTIFIASELKNKENIQLKSSEIVDGQNYYVLDIKNNSSVRSLLYINPKTYLIDIYVPIDYKTGVKSALSTNTYLSDYREVQGFLFPFQSSFGFEAQNAKNIIQSIQINPILDNKIFSPEGK